MTARRGVRTVGVGLLLGLLLSLAYVSRAQVVEPVPVPLVTALQAVALAADVNLVIAGVPAVDVYLPSLTVDWRGVLFGLAMSHGLMVCEIAPDTVLVSESSGAAALCVQEKEEADESVAVEAAAPVEAADVSVPGEAEPVVAGPAPSEAVGYRLRVVQIDETRAASLGIDWAGQAFETASVLAAGVSVARLGYFPSAVLDDVIQFMEREGIGTRLEDLELAGVEGVPVSFNRGGSINVSLVGGGQGTVQRTFVYGLVVTVVGEREEDALLVTYRLSDSSPSNVADPQNVQLNSTDTQSVVRVPCGAGVVLASLYSERSGGEGSALPVLGRVPGLGYAAGVGTDTLGKSALVLTLEVECRGGAA